MCVCIQCQYCKFTHASSHRFESFRENQREAEHEEVSVGIDERTKVREFALFSACARFKNSRRKADLTALLFTCDGCGRVVAEADTSACKRAAHRRGVGRVFTVASEAHPDCERVVR